MDRHTKAALDNMTSKETSRPLEIPIIHHHANARMVQNVLLIWLDNRITEENDRDCRNTVSQLQSVVNTMKIFTDQKKCIEFISNMKNEKICLITSGSLGRKIVPDIHDLSHLISIFIFCANKSLHEGWTQEWAKVRGVYTDIIPICETLKEIVQQCEQNSISIHFVATIDKASSNDSDKICPSFLFTQILKDIILNIDFEENHFQQLIDYCRIRFANNKYELKNIDMFERKYYYTTPIWWYTHDSFLYPMLNRGLQMIDVNIITKMSFFIGDLHHQIERVHKEQFNGSQNVNSFTVYHGQGISKKMAEQMLKTKGGFISFNSFLCASTDRRIPCDFAQRAATNPDLVGIVFVVTIDPSKSTTPFVFINSINRLDGKEEVLFPMHTVFCIREIQSMGENNRLFQVDLTLTNENNEDRCVLTNRIREAAFSNLKGWYRLVHLLMKMKQFEKAQQIYEILLEQTTDESEKGSIYYQIGRMKDEQMMYRDAITFYEKSIEIYEKCLRLSRSDLATSYDGIASAYEKTNEYSKALYFYEKALEIWQKTLDPNHPDLVASHHKIQFIRSKLSDESKASPSGASTGIARQESLLSNSSRWAKHLDFLKNRLVIK